MLIFKEIAVSAKLLLEKSAEKVSESAEKSAENKGDGLSKRQKLLLQYMEKEVLYSTKEFVTTTGLGRLRTRQFLFKPCFKTRI